MNRCALKQPRTFNRFQQRSAIIADDFIEEHYVSKRSRTHEAQIPTAWDDVVVSGYREGKFRKAPSRIRTEGRSLTRRVLWPLS
jgi:hypothetical protein